MQIDSAGERETEIKTEREKESNAREKETKGNIRVVRILDKSRWGRRGKERGAER